MLKIRKGHRAVGIAASICAVILFGFIINPAAKNQESAEAITDLTGETAITMTSINNAASITIDPSKTGVFATTSGANDISFSVATSNYTGYALSVRSTKTTIDKDDNSFTSLASSVTAEQFSTSSNTTLNNRWGFKPNFYNSESNSRYFGISTTAVTLDRTSTANTTAKNYTISLGARADTSLPSGTYINENLVLEATANIIPSSILTVNYGTGVTGVTVGGVTIANGETVKLIRGASYQINMTYDQTLYSFDSWSATSGTIGSSNTQSTTYAISTTDATLTANVAFIGSDMQNLSSALCTSTPRLVKDNRDNHIYTVQRLDDGNCWMMENLDLGRTPLTTNLTSANTNIGSTVTTSTFNGWRKTSGNATYIAGELIPVEGTDSTSGTAYGTLYNYYATSAGTIAGGTNTSDAQYDICPAGWRLPTGGSTGEFQALYAEYNSNALMRAPVANGGAAFALSGDFTNSTPTGQGNYGYYWSSKRDSSTYMYNLVVSTSYVSNGVSYRSSGYAIRCILKKQISDLNYLQDFKNLTEDELSSVAASMAENTTYNLIDNRDNRVYAVAKLKDGRIWMAENLDLGRTTLTTDLTSSNTNLTATVTASTFNSWKKTSGTATYDVGEFISITGTDTTSGTPYGTLYNYYAASVGTITGTTNNNNANSDICPAGWRLPTGSYFEEFQTLYTQYNSNALMRAPIENSGAAFALAGHFGSGTPTLQDSFSGYWSSSKYSDEMMFRLDLNKTSVAPTNSYYRNEGYAIRCILKKPSHTLTVSYGTGVTNVTINGISMANGGTISLEESVSYSVNATLSSNYYFAGWSATSGTLGSTSARPTTYTISSSNATLIVSATFNGTYMQNLNADVCTTTASTVYDSRDMHAYTIQRLNDGSCWMMENLDLGRTTLTTNLTSSNTNLSATITASTFNSWKTTAGIDSYVDGQFITLNGTDSTSGTAYGTLYNYYTASAGTISGSSNNSNATYDICPAGWRLPTGGETGDFYRLYSSGYDYNTLRTPIISGGAQFALAGYFYAGAPTGAESSGRYWSSTPYNSTSFMGMHFYDGTVYPAMWNFHYFARNKVGASIRCILKESRTITKLKYLQSFKYFSSGEMAEVLASMANNTTYNLTDMRDNRVYAVAKLKDDRIWMAENLNLGRTSLTTDLTSSNTNLSATVTASTFNSWKKTTSSSSYTSGVFVALSGSDSTSGNSYGTLYNYYAASAGTVSGNSYTSNAQYDICPAGWRLTSEIEINNLDSKYSGSNMHSAITNGGAAFPYSGEFSGSTLQSQGESGNYWTSTATSYSDSMWMYSNDDWGGLEYEAKRNLGASVRCIAKKPSHTITVIYGTGIAQISINGNNIANNSSITFEEGTSQTISASTEAGYSFGNWSTTSGTIGSITGQSTTYLVGANDATITATAIFNPPDIQNLASSSCTATASSAKDTRDGHIYTIQRLADGNCWMMENLDLGRTDLTTNLTSANTNLSTTVTAATFNSWKKTSGTGTYDAGEFIPLTAQNSGNGFDTDITSGTPYGTLYNYYAASAGTITGNSNANHAQYDICPAGWRLPTGGDYGEFQTLYQQYNSSASMRAPIANGGAAFTLAGRFKDSVPYDQNANGSYWSSSAFDSTGRKILYSNSAWIDPISSYYNRYMASSIRCVLKDLSITYLQDFNSLSTNDKTSIIASMAENTTYSLIDNRDNRSYKIAKLKDGKVWMAENLDLGRTTLSTNLTSANTNLSTTVTAATFNSWKKTSGTADFATGQLISISDADSTSGTAYGTLYNYHAASAGTITGLTNYNNASYDICPAGWRLPTGGNSGEFQALYAQYNSNALMRTPITSGGAAFALPGTFGNGDPVGQGNYGIYWSSVWYNDGTNLYMYSLEIDTSYVEPYYNYYRSDAGSIRCVVK